MVTTLERPIEHPVVREASEVVERKSYGAVGYIWGLLRLGMGWTFLWAFFDKLLGLGYATTSEGAWINGGSPTFGFLNFASKGPLAESYQSIAGNAVIDWLFMLGLIAIGLPLMLGVGVKLAGYTGVAMLALMYTAGFILPENNPFLDEHIIYAVIVIGLIVVPSGHWLGLGNFWTGTRLVRKYRFLE